MFKPNHAICCQPDQTQKENKEVTDIYRQSRKVGTFMINQSSLTCLYFAIFLSVECTSSFRSDRQESETVKSQNYILPL